MNTLERARAYISEIPGAIAGSGGHTQTYKVALVLVQDFGLSDAEALALLREWNATCSPPWDEADLLHKIADARKNLDPAKVGCKAGGGERTGQTYTDAVHQFRDIRSFTMDAMRTLGAEAAGYEVHTPERNERGEVTATNRRRGDNKPFDSGDKSLCKKGGKRGLFMPWPLPADDPVLVVEGLPDALRAITAGHKTVIGLPNAKPGRKLLEGLARLLAGRDVVICPDPGQAGRESLAQVGRFLANAGCRVRFIPATDQDLDDRLKGELDQAGALARLIAGALPWTEPKPVVDTSTPDGWTGDLPVLELPGGATTISACSKVLYALLAETGRFFLRGGRVVTVEAVAGGGVAVQPITPEAMRSLPEKYFRPFAWRSDGRGNPVLKPSPMTRDQAGAILECEERAALPDLRGLSGCALLLADGRVIGPGYDHASGIYVTGGEVPATVPTQEAARDLAALLDDFDFVSPGDRSRALAGLVTPALRLGGFLPLAPIDVAEADQSQAGKGFRQNLVAAIFNEVPQAVAQRAQGGVGSFDETLASQLYRGRPFVQLDNLRGKIDSPYLESLVTAGVEFPIRIPHHGQSMICPQSFVLMATSNSVELTPDLANRASITRIRKRPESYMFRRYPEGGVLDHVRAKQGYYLGCVFAVVHAWIDAGRPQTDEGRHDFRKWSQSLDWIVQNVFQAAPLMAGHKEAKQRASDPGLTFARSLAVQVEQTGDLGRGLSASELYELAENHGVVVPGLREPDDKQGARVVGKILGRLLSGRDAADVDGYQISVEARRVPRPDGNGYFDMKFYSFGRGGDGSRNRVTTVDTVDTVEVKDFLGNDAISKEVISSTVVNCGNLKDNKVNARAFLARLAARGVVLKIDGPRISFLGHPTEAEMEEYRRLNGAVREVLLEAEEQDLFSTGGVER